MDYLVGILEAAVEVCWEKIVVSHLICSPAVFASKSGHSSYNASARRFRGPATRHHMQAIRDLAPLLRSVVATILVSFEGHKGLPGLKTGPPS